jgi:hypothetical protein
MTDTRIPSANPRYFFRCRRAICAVTMAAMAGLSALFPALAGPPQPGESFAHKYTPVYGETVGKINLALMVRAPSFQTLIEAQFPVTVRINGRLEVRGGDPWVAFWKRIRGKPGAILRYEDLGRVMEPRGEEDVQAMEAVRRVFKWAPVMRLAMESDPAAFETFVRRLEQIRINTVTTPRLLIDE